MTRLNLTLLATGLSACLAVQTLDAQSATDNRGPRKSVPAASGLTIERISQEPDTPLDVVHIADPMHWSPDGKRVAWMKLHRPEARAFDPALQQEIWTYAPESEKPANPAQSGKPMLLLSAERITSALSGAAPPTHASLPEESDSNPFLLRDFTWAPGNAAMLLAGAQSISWIDFASGNSRILVKGDDPITDAALSPDGKTVSFVRGHKLCLVSVTGGPIRTFAASGKPDVLEGELDWPYRNSLHLTRGYAWSPDSASIAYLEIDDRAVAKHAFHSSSGEMREIAYPKAGGALPLVRVFARHVKAGSLPVEVHFGPTKDLYVPRFGWAPDSRHLSVERLSRRQQKLDLFLADTLTGKSSLVLSETDQYWVNLADGPLFLTDGKRFLWSSERSGFRHLYLYSTDGKELAQLTKGNWEITRVHGVDEAKGLVYFTATEKSPLERHLYKVGLDGSGMARITQQPGTHDVSMAPDTVTFLDTYSNHSSSPRQTLQSLAQTAPGSEKPSDAPAMPPLQPVEFLTLKMHLGADAHAFLIKPPAFDASKKYPVIVYMAGGPGEQLVRDAWGGATGLWMQWMAQKGYIVFAMDNQATAGRGHAFEEPIHLRLGGQEMADQRDGLLYLATLPYVDQSRLGVCGWGYGGFLAVHAILDRPVAYKAGFAGAPIIDWHLYDAVFAERYLDDPVAHADGWDASTALENDTPKFFKGSLLVAQGTEDEFVPMENLLTLQDHLLDAGKSADVLLFPDRGHELDDPGSRQVLFTRMTEFFIKNL